MSAANPNKKSDDSEGRRADDWLTYAIVLGIFSIAGIAWFLVWAFDVEEVSRVTRIDVVYKVALLCAAVVTFCTVVWRGLISARQANYMQKQIDNLARQIAATEENNLAGLLQKGAELLGQIDNRAHVAAGIATLQSLVTADNPKFAREAMELLADHIDEKYQSNNDGPLFKSIVQALEAGAARGIVAARTVDFSWNESTTGAWVVFRGVEKLRYVGGAIENYDDFYGRPKGVNLECVGVHLRHCEIDRVDGRFSHCQFERCGISDLALSNDASVSFIGCDFSDATVSGSILASVIFDNCYFSRQHPPQFPMEWLEKLAVLEDPEIETDETMDVVDAA